MPPKPKEGQENGWKLRSAGGIEANGGGGGKKRGRTSRQRPFQRKLRRKKGADLRTTAREIFPQLTLAIRRKWARYMDWEELPGEPRRNHFENRLSKRYRNGASF